MKWTRCGLARGPAACLLVVLSALWCRVPVAAQSPARPPQFSGVGIEQKMGAQVPTELTFRDSSGQPVKLHELLTDRPVILNLVYYECPMLCNMAMNGLIQSLRTLSFEPGKDFRIVTVSFDPREGPALATQAKRTALARYGRDTPEDWFFLTGEEEPIRKLAESVGFKYRWDPQRGQYAHAAGVVVLTPQGEVSRYLLGVEYAPRDLQLSLVEASNNEIGSISEQILLLCYQYDPARGKYGFLIHNVIRAAGGLLVAAMGTFIGLMLWRERKASRDDAPADGLTEEATGVGRL